MTDSGLFCRRTDSLGIHEIRAGCLALGGVTLFLLAMSALDTTLLHETRALELTWTDGHADSRSFRIEWPGEYVFALQPVDSNVAIGDQPTASANRQWAQRCEGPFPAGLTWSVRRFERVIERRTMRTYSWCEDPSRGHEPGAVIGSFWARSGAGYSIRIEPIGGASAQSSPRLAMHMNLWLFSRWFDGNPILLICATLVLFGVTSIALGCAHLLRDRF